MENAYRTVYRFCAQNAQTILYSAVCFFVPLLLGHPQLLVGVIVNFALVMAALNRDGVYVAPIILLPSIAVLARGLIFGPFTVFLVYLIPFIWAGNYIIVLAVSRFRSWKGVLLGSGAKSLFLFLCALGLYSLGIIPEIFLSAMGLLQLATALSGGIVALLARRALAWAKEI